MTFSARLKDEIAAIKVNTIEARIELYALLRFDGNFDKIAIVHSNFNDKVAFCKELQEWLSKKNKTGKIYEYPIIDTRIFFFAD